MGIGKHYVSSHALKRVSALWLAAKTMSKRDLLERLASSIEFAEQNRLGVKTPGGLYLPFDLEGEEGFLVIKDDCVVTAVPKEWATEVSEYLRKENHDG